MRVSNDTNHIVLGQGQTTAIASGIIQSKCPQLDELCIRTGVIGSRKLYLNCCPTINGSARRKETADERSVVAFWC